MSGDGGMQDRCPTFEGTGAPELDGMGCLGRDGVRTGNGALGGVPFPVSPFFGSPLAESAARAYRYPRSERGRRAHPPTSVHPHAALVSIEIMHFIKIAALLCLL